MSNVQFDPRTLADQLSRAYWESVALMPESAKTTNERGVVHAPALDVFVNIIGDLYRAEVLSGPAGAPREEFERKYAHLDLSTQKAPWGGTIYRSTRVRDLWEGWEGGATFAEPPAIPPESGYVEAFYEMAQMLGFGAQAQSPEFVYKTMIRPRLQTLLRHEQAIKAGQVERKS